MRSRAAMMCVALGVSAVATPAARAESCSLARERHRLRVWQWSWGVAVAAGTLAQLAAIPFVDDTDADTRIDLALGAATTVVGLVPVVLAPAVPSADGDECAAVARLGRDERAARGPWMHVANLAFNGAVVLVYGLGFGHWTAGVLNGVAGAAIGEVELLTMPVAERVVIAPAVGDHAVGARLSITF